MDVIKLNKREAIKAVKKPSMVKPGVHFAANKSISALIIQENNPRVRIVIGKVKRWRRGLIVILISPIISTAIIAFVHSVMLKPGKNLAMIRRVITLTINHFAIR